MLEARAGVVQLTIDSCDRILDGEETRFEDFIADIYSHDDSDED